MAWHNTKCSVLNAFFLLQRKRFSRVFSPTPARTHSQPERRVPWSVEKCFTLSPFHRNICPAMLFGWDCLPRAFPSEGETRGWVWRAFSTKLCEHERSIGGKGKQKRQTVNRNFSLKSFLLLFQGVEEPPVRVKKKGATMMLHGHRLPFHQIACCWWCHQHFASPITRKIPTLSKQISFIIDEHSGHPPYCFDIYVNNHLLHGQLTKHLGWGDTSAEPPPAYDTNSYAPVEVTFHRTYRACLSTHCSCAEEGWTRTVLRADYKVVWIVSGGTVAGVGRW